MVVASIARRALTTRPVPGDVELTQFAVALAISLALPWCQLRGANILVDFFTQRLPARGLRLLDAAGCALVASMCALLAWRTGAGALAVRQAGETSMILSLPMWWVYASLAPGLALTAVVALVQAVQHLRGRPAVPADGAGAGADAGADADAGAAAGAAAGPGPAAERG